MLKVKQEWLQLVCTRHDSCDGVHDAAYRADAHTYTLEASLGVLL